MMLSLEFLEGKWRNDFMLEGIQDFEICEIDAEGRYFVDDVHWFNVIDITHDAKLDKLTFIKSAVQDGDSRQFLNIIAKISQNYIENEKPTNEQKTYSISYTRILE